MSWWLDYIPKTEQDVGTWLIFGSLGYFCLYWLRAIAVRKGLLGAKLRARSEPLQVNLKFRLVTTLYAGFLTTLSIIIIGTSFEGSAVRELFTTTTVRIVLVLVFMPLLGTTILALFIGYNNVFRNSRAVSAVSPPLPLQPVPVIGRLVLAFLICNIVAAVVSEIVRVSGAIQSGRAQSIFHLNESSAYPFLIFVATILGLAAALDYFHAKYRIFDPVIRFWRWIKSFWSGGGGSGPPSSPGS